MSIENKLKLEHVYKILTYLQADPKIDTQKNNIVSRTVCHNGIGNGSRKLIYYNNSRLFVCYSGCADEHFGAIELIKRAKRVSYYEAVDIIEKVTGVSEDYIKYSVGFDEEVDENENLEDELYLNLNNNYKKEEEYKLIKYDKNILNNFYPIYHKSFLDDNISIKAMKHYGILFDVEKNRIIIPHIYHEDDSLVAVRCRNLNSELIDLGLKYTPIKMPFYNKKCKKMVKMPIVNKTSSYIYGVPMVREAIISNKIVILFEAEKSPMQMYTYYGDKSTALATMGSNLDKKQIDILLSLGVEEVVIAYDKEYRVYGDADDKLYRKKLRKRLIEKLLPYFKVSVIYDRWNKLDYKDSPSDKGKEIFEFLFEKRFYIKG